MRKKKRTIRGTRRRCNHCTVASYVRDIDLFSSSSCSSTRHHRSHLRVARKEKEKKKKQKIEFLLLSDCPRSVTMRAYMYITTTIGECIDFSSFSFSFVSLFSPFSLRVLFTRATASVCILTRSRRWYLSISYSIHSRRVYISVCLLYTRERENGEKERKRGRNIQSTSDAKKKKKSLCSVLFSLFFLSTNKEQIQLDR